MNRIKGIIILIVMVMCSMGAVRGQNAEAFTYYTLFLGELKDIANGYCSFDDIRNTYEPKQCFDENIDSLIFEEDSIRSLLKENGIVACTDILIVEQHELIDGFVVCAETNESIYFMPVFFNNQAHGDFINKKIYSAEEFDSVSIRESRYIVYGFETNDPVKPMMVYDRIIPIEKVLKDVGIDTV